MHVYGGRVCCSSEVRGKGVCVCVCALVYVLHSCKPLSMLDT
jgi:hypothetical protein